MKKDKTRFEKWFSFSRHKRRFGAKALSDGISTDFKKQKNIITGTNKQCTNGSSHSVETHFIALKDEFIESSELCYTHARLIVLIRRDFEAKEHFKIFQKLWQQEKKYLLKNLNTRWLIAASDTFADYSNDEKTQSLALACALLFNTIKIQETERLINSASEEDNQEIIDTLQAEVRVNLFDGTSAFAIGTDDTLRNMRWRIDKITKNNIAGDILLEIFTRLQNYDTVYKRFKDKHIRDKTGWW